jgi:hypothetical protein
MLQAPRNTMVSRDMPMNIVVKRDCIDLNCIINIPHPQYIFDILFRQKIFYPCLAASILATRKMPPSEPKLAQGHK